MALDALYQDDQATEIGIGDHPAIPVPLKSVVVADRHPLFVKAVDTILSSPPCRPIAVAAAQTVEELSAVPTDVLVVANLSLPDMRGVVGLEALLKLRPSRSVVALLDEDDPALALYCRQRALAGVIAKTQEPEVVRRTLRAAVKGIPAPVTQDTRVVSDKVLDRLSLYRRLATLSPKQAEVLFFLRDGLLNKQIAYELGLTEATVKHHISLILKKLGCYRRTQAVAIANRLPV